MFSAKSRFEIAIDKVWRGKRGGDSMLKETLPNIKLHDVDGGPVETDDLRGRNVLIFMWASW